MAFEPEKDKVIKKWECRQTGLVVSINQYGDSLPKVQIGPRVFIRKDGKISQSKAGRLSLDDLLWVYEIIDEVKEDLMRTVKPE
ncbi:MAG: hypothetical protein A2V65_09105 [Deltaproteobacteria bacterium RBG_13_49_15]|nr:MAG: hypothetical protein A2V65_09105 [Deltaproteobacteria bacterium RBG_13_49_15]